jgi:MFS family permease
VLGPAIGLGLYEAFDHRIRPLLWVALVPAVLSVLLIRWVAEPARPATGATPRPVVSAAGLPPELRSLLVVLGVFSLVNFPDALLLLRAHDLGLSTGGVIGAYILYNAVYAAAAYPAGALSDRLPRYLVFAIGLECFSTAYMGLGLVHSSGWVFVLLPIYGMFAACTDGVGKAWVAALAPADRPGAAQGLYQAVTGAGVLVAGVIAGLAWHSDGRVPLIVAGIVASTMAIVLALHGARWDHRPVPA